MEAESALSPDFEFDASPHLRHLHQGYFQQQSSTLRAEQDGYDAVGVGSQNPRLPVKRLVTASSSANNDITYESWASASNWASTMPSMPGESLTITELTAQSPFLKVYHEGALTPGLSSSFSALEEPSHFEAAEYQSSYATRTSPSQQSVLSTSYAEQTDYRVATVSSVVDDLVAESFLSNLAEFESESPDEWTHAAFSSSAARASSAKISSSLSHTSTLPEQGAKLKVQTLKRGAGAKPKRLRPNGFDEMEQELSDEGESKSTRSLRRIKRTSGLSGYVRAVVEESRSLGMDTASTPRSSEGGLEMSSLASLVIIDNYRFV